MKYDGSTWGAVGTAGFSDGQTEYPFLAIYNGIPYVSYLDVFNSSKATVKKFNGSVWETVGSSGFSAGETMFLYLAFSNGTPYVAYMDGGNSGKATVMKYDVE
jgi:hypothetical protein